VAIGPTIGHLACFMPFYPPPTTLTRHHSQFSHQWVKSQKPASAQFSIWIENFKIHNLLLPNDLWKFAASEPAREWLKSPKVAIGLPHARESKAANHRPVATLLLSGFGISTGYQLLATGYFLGCGRSLASTFPTTNDCLHPVHGVSAKR
jgi:hypothetical protein